MSGGPEHTDPQGAQVPEPASGMSAGAIGPVLLRCGRERFSGLLRVEGSPGGTICFRGGLVVAATTPASPGPESLLLRSGQVSDEDWTRAYTAGAPSGRLDAELVKLKSVGVARLEGVCLAAVFDAVFAIALCGVRDIGFEAAGPDDLLPPLVVRPGAEPDRLVRETGRRLSALPAWRAIGLNVRSRPVIITPDGSPPVQADEIRRAILLRANGRGTARDLAFSLGRGLYAVMSEIARMVDDGLVTLEAPRTAAGPTPEPVSPAGETAPRSLPQRTPGTSKVAEVLAPGPLVDKPSLPRRLLKLRGAQTLVGGEEE